MARITAAKKAKFPEPDLEDFVVAGSERSCEVLGPYKCEEPTCVVCGARLRDVFVTNYGPMGGDCFATLSGNPETRKAYRKLVKLFDQVEPWGIYGTQWSLWGHQIMYMKIEVSPASYQSQGNLVWVKFHQYDPESMREYDRRVGHVPEQPGVVEYLRGWAADHNIGVMQDGVWQENPVRVLTKSQYEQRMAEGASTPEFPAAKASALERLASNEEQGFVEWMHERYDEQTVEESLADPDTRLGEIEDWASEACDVHVTDDGYVQFDQLGSSDECDTEEAVGGLPVLVYHHTTSGALKGIREQRGLVSGRTLGYEPTEHNSADYVFVTTRRSGPEINGYVWRARERFGGDHVILTIKTTLYELEPDPDDADLPTGRTQFVLDRVGLDDIVEVWPPRYEKALRPRQKPPRKATKTKQSKLPPGSKYIPGPRRGQKAKDNPVGKARPLVVVHLSSLDAYALRREMYRALKSEGLIIESNPVGGPIQRATSADEVDDATLAETLSDLGVTTETSRFDRLAVIRKAFPKMGASDHLRLNRRATEALGAHDKPSAWEVGQRQQRGGIPGGVLPVGEVGTRASVRASRAAARKSMRRVPKTNPVRSPRLGSMQRFVLEAVHEHGDPYFDEPDYNIRCRRQTVASKLIRRGWLRLRSHTDPGVIRGWRSQWVITPEGKQVLGVPDE